MYLLTCLKSDLYLYVIDYMRISGLKYYVLI